MGGDAGCLRPDFRACTRKRTRTLLSLQLAVEGHCLFTKLAASVLLLDNALALYHSPMLWQAKLYREAAADLKRGILPALLWIYLGIARTERGIFAYTDGLRRFGKEEIEITASLQPPHAVFDLLCDVVNCIVSENAVLQPGETIGLSADQQLPITRSTGVFMKGESLKIAF